MKRSPMPRRRTPLRRVGRKCKAERTELDFGKQCALARDGWECQGPRRGLDVGCAGRLEVHHILPRSRGGLHALSNLITLCAGCHRYVHAHPAVAYRLGLLTRSQAA